MSNEQKVAIITGASQGIGAALVRAYRDRSYRVIATSRSIQESADAGILACGCRPTEQSLRASATA